MSNNNENTTHNDRIVLSMDLLTANIGKTIDWFCYGYSKNLPYSGQCKILGSEIDKRGHTVPVIEHIKGDRLQYAWLEDGIFNYTDSGRLVYVGKEFELYTLSWENPKSNMLFSTDTAMQYSIIRYLNSGSTLEQLIKKATSAEVVKIMETGDLYIRSNGEYVPQLLMM